MEERGEQVELMGDIYSNGQSDCRLARSGKRQQLLGLEDNGCFELKYRGQLASPFIKA